MPTRVPQNTISMNSLPVKVLDIMYTLLIALHDLTTKLLKEKYPDLDITHSAYPLSLTKQRLVLGLETLRFGALGVVIFSDQISAALGNIQMPPFWNNIRANKISSCAFLWFIGGSFTQSFQKTGAFEIYYNGNLVFSKLKENRLPMISEITSGIDSHTTTKSTD
eukprot:g9194.t1